MPITLLFETILSLSTLIHCKQIPATAYYIPSFITEQEEQFILQQIENTPRPKWTQLSNRRLINYGGVPHKNGMIVENMPKWLQQQVKAINSLGNSESNRTLFE